MNHIPHNGFVVLHRKMIEWEWYQDANTMRLFIHCILRANHKAKKWQGIEIQRGQFISSSDKLAADLKLTRQQIRTSLNKLKSTSEITISTTARYSMITVCAYNDYQDNNQPDNKPVTNGQPTDNQLITTNNNDNNDNNDNNKDFEQFWLLYPKKVSKAQAKKSWLKIKPDDSLVKQIISSVKLFKTSNEWQKDNGKYIPMAATWLNNERWTDELNYSGESYERNQSKQHRKQTPLERMEEQLKIDELRAASYNNNGEVLGKDDSVISTQVGKH